MNDWTDADLALLRFFCRAGLVCALIGFLIGLVA